MVLAEIKNGEKARLLDMSTGCRMQSRLTDMGLAPGMEVDVISNIPGRPMILASCGARLVVCRNIAARIRVSGGNGVAPAIIKDQQLQNEEKGMSKQVCLRQMCVNQRGIIRSVKAEGELGRRIRDMGLVPNTEVTIVGRAPLKDPVALRLRDFTLSLRNNEADFITVEVAGG